MSVNAHYVDYDLKKAATLLQIGITKHLNDEEMDAILRCTYQVLTELKQNVERQARASRKGR